jgi:hypothetical protein
MMFKEAEARGATIMQGVATGALNFLMTWSDPQRGTVLADCGARLSQHPALVAAGRRRVDAAIAHADVSAELEHNEHVVAGLRALAAEEPLHESPDLSLYLRSRMTIALGLTFRAEELTEGDANAIAHEIGVRRDRSRRVPRRRKQKRRIPRAHARPPRKRRCLWVARL